MKKPLMVLVLSALVLGGCGGMRDSRLNPFNWFGRSTSQPVAAEGEVNPLIPRRRISIFRDNQPETYQGTLIASVVELLIERRPGGAIIRATGVADRQGPFDLRLVKVDEESDDDTLTFDFRALRQPGAVGTDRSRTVTVALWVTDQQLTGIREVRVKGRSNIRTTRR